MYNGNELGTQVTQVTIVGMGFVPNHHGNVEIDRLLGFESESYGAVAHRRNKDDAQAEIGPNYCEDPSLCIDIMERFETVPICLPTQVTAPKRGKLCVQEYIAVFELTGTLYATTPFPSENHAIACALWFCAGISDSKVISQ